MFPTGVGTVTNADIALKALELTSGPFCIFSFRDWAFRRYYGRPKLGWEYNLFVSFFVATFLQFLFWLVN